MEGLFDVVVFVIKFKNILIQYYSIEDDKWRVVKKTVNYLNYLYLGYIFFLMNWLMIFKMVWKNMDYILDGCVGERIVLIKVVV